MGCSGSGSAALIPSRDHFANVPKILDSGRTELSSAHIPELLTVSKAPLLELPPQASLVDSIKRYRNSHFREVVVWDIHSSASDHVSPE